MTFSLSPESIHLHRSGLRVSLLFLLLPFVALSAETQTLQIGSLLSDIEFKDQHDRPHTLSEDLRFIVFSADMEGGRIIHAFMEGRDDDYLKTGKIALIADIHRMPSLIARAIALPRMRDYTYSLYLIRDDERGGIYQHRPQSTTVFVLKNRSVQAIHFAASPTELQAILDSNPAP